MSSPGRLDRLRRSLSYFRLSIGRNSAAPVYLVLFVKGTCHAKCLHCFLPSLEEHHTARKELSVPEIEKLSHHLGPDIYSVLLAGGEPFLRKDLGDIIEVLSCNQQVRAIKVVSNGFFTDRVVSTWERILKLKKNKYYSLTISFDGLKELHEYIRGVPGIFDKAVDTFKQLNTLSQEYGNLEVDVNITISHFNQDHLAPLYQYLRDSLQAGNVTCTVTRGAPRDTLAKDVEVAKYVQVKNWLEQDLTSGGKLRGNARFERPDTLNAINILQRNRIASMLANGKYISPCNAGRLSAVIGSDGKVYPCELLNDALGDLRENDYNLMKIWSSKAAREIRKTIYRTNCFCTYENANLLNTLFTPRYYPQILLTAMRIKWGRRFAKRLPADLPATMAKAPPKVNNRSLTHLILNQPALAAPCEKESQ